MPDTLPPATAAWEQLSADAGRIARDHPGGVPVHAPQVAVLSCSDARVPPSTVFGRPAGDLFVVRIAGNTASPTAVASLEYAVAQLGVELIVVLGHTSCGAVAAAIAGTCDGSLAPVVAPICSVVAEHPGADATEISHLNVAASTRDVVAASPTIAAAVASGRLEIRGAVYDLETGMLDQVADTPQPPEPRTQPPTRTTRPDREPQETTP